MKPHLRTTVETLLEAGASQREIARRLGVDRKTVRRYARARNSPTLATGSEGEEGQSPPPQPPGREGPRPAVGDAVSACAEHRAWIEARVQLGRNAVSIYQELVETRGFMHRYNSVKRFVRKLRVREPQRLDVLEFLPGEEAQVDFGQGAPTLHRNGRYKRPWLFVMPLEYWGLRGRRKVTDLEDSTSNTEISRYNAFPRRTWWNTCSYPALAT